MVQGPPRRFHQMGDYLLHDFCAPCGFTPDDTVFSDVEAVVVSAFNHEGYRAANYGRGVGPSGRISSGGMNLSIAEAFVRKKLWQTCCCENQGSDFVTGESQANRVMLGATATPFAVVPSAPFQLEDTLRRVMLMIFSYQNQFPPGKNGVLLIPVPNAAL